MLSSWTRVGGRLRRQLLRQNPFRGEHGLPTRVPLCSPLSSRPCLPFPHPWNYSTPLRILESFFCGADLETGLGRHNRYLEFPGCAPILVTRDPAMIRAITTETGDRDGQFDRDTLPSTGIARATGRDTLLFANGATWKRQRKLAASPFGKTTLFQPERFHEFETTFRHTVATRLRALEEFLDRSGQSHVTLTLEPEVKAVMLEMLANNFFGAEIPYDEIRNTFVPSLECVIDHIVRDTVLNKLGLPITVFPRWLPGMRPLRDAYDRFDDLTDRVLSGRSAGRGLWTQFKSDAPDVALRPNLKVFLAGALEATTSYACWAISHLSRAADVQEQLAREVDRIDSYSPEALEAVGTLRYVLDETLRLTPALYFLPRRATVDTLVTTADQRSLWMPAGTHLLLDVWHANRHEDHWGIAATGYPALAFAPQRWAALAEAGRASKERLHFGFGHGPRVCPGKHLGELEVSLVVGAFVKLFRFSGPAGEVAARAGVSTKPADGTTVTIERRARPAPLSSTPIHAAQPTSAG